MALTADSIGETQKSEPVKKGLEPLSPEAQYLWNMLKGWDMARHYDGDDRPLTREVAVELLTESTQIDASEASGAIEDLIDQGHVEVIERRSPVSGVELPPTLAFPVEAQINYFRQHAAVTAEQQQLVSAGVGALAISGEAP